MDRHFLMSRVLRTAWLIFNFQFSIYQHPDKLPKSNALTICS